MKTLCLFALAALLGTGCVTRTYTEAAPPPPGPSVADIQSLVQAHVSDSVIIAQIQNSSTRYQLTADQIITLKNAGASDPVLNALLNTANKPTPQPRTTVVTESYPSVYVDPWPYYWWWGWGPYYYYPHSYYHGGYYHGGYYRRGR
jgi:hypothetical protein